MCLQSCRQEPEIHLLSGTGTDAVRITIVISPLISLMQDQVKALNEAGIHAAFINSSLSESQISKALYLAAGGRYKIIYVAPERLENYEFLEFARQVEISMVTVMRHIVFHSGARISDQAMSKS